MVSTATRPKATLFCPECGHESPADGHWEVRRCGTREVLVCPQCAVEVTARPRADERLGASTPAGSTSVGLLTRAALAWQRLAVALPSIGSRF